MNEHIERHLLTIDQREHPALFHFVSSNNNRKYVARKIKAILESSLLGAESPMSKVTEIVTSAKPELKDEKKQEGTEKASQAKKSKPSS